MAKTGTSAYPSEMWVDSNVLLRLITGDPPKQAEEAAQLAEYLDRGILTLRVPSIVFAELCWVLESFYGKHPTEIAKVLTQLTEVKGLEVEEKEIVLEALRDYDEQHVDYIDAYIAAKARHSKCPTVLTWNQKHFRRLQVGHVAPGEFLRSAE